MDRQHLTTEVTVEENPVVVIESLHTSSQVSSQVYFILESACTCTCICCVPPVSCRTLLVGQTSACDNRTTSFSSTLPFRSQLYRTRQVDHARVLINVQHRHTHSHTHLSLWFLPNAGELVCNLMRRQNSGTRGRTFDGE
jgi:hypothetical protein